MKSHEWAKKLRATADILEARPDVELGASEKVLLSFYGRKDEFLAAVRALKPGKKIMDNDYVNFEPTGTNFHMYINRDAVCRKVKEAEYECLPLLSPEEDAAMEGAYEQPQIPDIPL